MPRRGGGWPRETVLLHSGKPTPPRFARLPLPEEGARMIFKEILIQSLSFAVRDSRSPPTYAAHFSAFLICLSDRQCPIRPFGAPSPRGEGWRYEESLRSTDLRASPRFVILSGEKGKVKMDKYTGKKNDASLLHDICGHRPIYSRRSRLLHSSLLTPNSNSFPP